MFYKPIMDNDGRHPGKCGSGGKTHVGTWENVACRPKVKMADVFPKAWNQRAETLPLELKRSRVQNAEARCTEPENIQEVQQKHVSHVHVRSCRLQNKSINKSCCFFDVQTSAHWKDLTPVCLLFAGLLCGYSVKSAWSGEASPQIITTSFLRAGTAARTPIHVTGAPKEKKKSHAEHLWASNQRGTPEVDVTEFILAYQVPFTECCPIYCLSLKYISERNSTHLKSILETSGWPNGSGWHSWRRVKALQSLNDRVLVSLIDLEDASPH